MNFIYDIILNFNDDLYEYFEWEIQDEIIHVKKIPIFKLNKKDYYNIKNNVVVFDHDFLVKISKQNQLYKNNKSKHFDYICLIAYEEEAIAIRLNNKGKVIQKSHLIIEEERCILKALNRIEISTLNYEIFENFKKNPYLTRRENEDIKTVIKEITKLYKSNEINKLSYLYLECFNMPEKNIDKIFHLLKTEVTKNPEAFNKAMDFFKLINQK